MPDHNLIEDDAALYVLGGLSTSERLEFEARLAESEQLRALVRDLEEGSAALALTAPPRRPPSGAWRQIEKSLSKENRPAHAARSLWIGLFRNGWAAAAACFVGWLLYALFFNHQLHPDSAAPSNVASQSGSAPGLPIPRPDDPAPSDRPEQTVNAVAVDGPALDSQMRQDIQLRHEILELQSRLTNLSHSLAEDDAMLSESNRFKISVLDPAPVPDEGSNTPSPELQRAIFAALARQLGWQPASDSNSPVQFVDLRPTNNASIQQSPPPSDVANDTPATQSNPVTATNNLAIPSLATKDGVILAIGPSAAPVGSQVSVTIPNDQGPDTTIPFSIGDYPTVITVPDGSVITVMPSGFTVSNFIQYVATNHP